MIPRAFRYIISTILVFNFYALFGQTHYLLDHFSAYRDEGRIILTWTIGKGNSCIGIGIYRSTDDVEYENIHNIFGECGSPEFAKFYSYIDENPVKNKTNYYSLELGFSGRTAPVAVRYDDIPEKGSIVVPNPLTNIGKILFANSEGRLLKIRIWDHSGRLIQHLTSRDNSLDLDMSKYGSGNFIYAIYDELNKLISSGNIIKAD